MSEVIDVFDANHVHLGVMERKAAHGQGLWHQTFHCWIVGKTGNDPFVLLQLRSPAKANYPDMLDITAAGHLEAGETPSDGIRELEEELGLSIKAEKLNYLGIKHDVMDEKGGMRNREFSHVYLLRDDRNMSGYTLAVDEVSGLVRMRVKDGLALFAGEVREVVCAAYRVTDDGPSNFDRTVTTADLIPRVDSYYLKIFMLADLMLSGYAPLAI